MKKIILLSALVATVTFTSCRKNRVCNCINTNTGNINNTTQTKEEIKNVNKKEGIADCNKLDTTYSYQGINTSRDCSLIY